MTRKSPLFNDERIRTSARRRPPPTPPPMPQPRQDTKDTPTTRATPDQEAMPTGMGNTASTANYRITPRMNVSKESERRNHAEIDKAEPIGLECT